MVGMTSIDSVGNAHRPAGDPAGGQFIPKTNTAPAASLAGEDEYPEVEMEFDRQVKAGNYDVDLAGKALRSAATRLLPGATAIEFSTCYTDEGPCLEFTGIRGGEHDGAEPSELDCYDEIGEIVFTMSGAGCTGEEITGMREIGDDHFTFDLGASA